jgi:hypothetical protein
MHRRGYLVGIIGMNHDAHIQVVWSSPHGGVLPRDLMLWPSSIRYATFTSMDLGFVISDLGRCTLSIAIFVFRRDFAVVSIFRKVTATA